MAAGWDSAAGRRQRPTWLVTESCRPPRQTARQLGAETLGQLRTGAAGVSRIGTAAAGWRFWVPEAAGPSMRRSVQRPGVALFRRTLTRKRWSGGRGGGPDSRRPGR